MSLREWLIAIGTLVIIGIVIDGLRRMRRARKESIAISSGMGADDLKESPLDDDHNPELPNGGARSISRDTLEERGYVRREKTSRFGAPQQKPTRPVYEAPGKDTPMAGNNAFDEDFGETGLSSAEPEEQAMDTGWGADNDGMSSQQPSERPLDVEEDTARREPPGEPHASAPDQPLAGANRPEASEVIVINVLARQGEDFSGAALQKLFEACGLEHGDMDIYHRHEAADTTTPVQFSVANAVEPGTFKPNDVAAMTTPGISFFMSMPGPTNALQAFDFMLETAQCVVRNLGGELKDERRSVMTAQTIEHCRQRIREFERKQRSPRR
ncbi:cell division protein ZipA [Streptosporangium jomthongense]|uniref:Cell division protein ZipA n=1 Tax=Marinobacter aromaticivorans TaxID=1494078 RepID=A0ABW2IXB2_9GAMM|nr:cell division protein ZipA [Marinobacter aromaticivorans]GGE70192.1 cell division protein ZipA [Streptosporangium jomthongense]